MISGKITCRYIIELTVNSDVLGEIAKSLTRFLFKSPACLGDRVKMKQFAEQNTAEQIY